MIQNFGKKYLEKIWNNTKLISSYKSEVELTLRKLNINNLMIKYPLYIPIVLETYDNKIHKLLLNRHSTFSELMFHVRRKIILNAEESIFIIKENGQLLNNTMIIGDIYEKAKFNGELDDGCLYLFVKKEPVFG